MSLLFLDVEATGTESEDRLCQVAYRYHGITRDELFKPPVPIKLTASAINHITNKMVENRPAFARSSAKDELLRFSAEGAIFVAHNAAFDLSMLAKEGVTFPLSICTLKVARHIDTEGKFENHTLQYLRYYYGLEVEATAHDALGDIIVLEAVFEKLLNEVITRFKFSSREDAYMHMIRLSALPAVQTHIRFGKYRDKSDEEQLITNIAKKDRGYLEWLLEQKKKKPQGEEDWIYTLERVLSMPT